MNDTRAKLNDWFLSLSEGRRIALMQGDRWMLADAAYEAALTSASKQAGGEPSDAEVAAFVERTVGTWREYDRDDMLMAVKAALKAVEPVRMCECGLLPHAASCSWERPDEPSQRNGGCGNGESNHG